MRFDTLIRNGLVIDGTGAAGRRADIGIIGDRISAMGDLRQAEAAQVVDATGKIVCPGFIDVHVHSELSLLDGADRYAPLRMGVTTQLASPDGFSWAPLEASRLPGMRDYLRVFYEDHQLDPYRQLSIADLLGVFAGRLPSNLALQVPHGSVRLAVMGWAARAASDEEIVRMQALVREWMEHGAKALATGLEYEPMRRADLRELVQLSKTAAEYGGIYVAHQRGYAAKVGIGCAETFAIGREANIPVHISHFTVDTLAGELVEQAVGEGTDVTFDMYPYPAGCTHMLLSFPEYAQEGSPDDVKARLRDPKFRDRLSGYVEQVFNGDLLVFASVAETGPGGMEGKSLSEVRRERGQSMTDTVCDILLESDLQALMILHWPQERHAFLETTFKHPLHMVCTDGIYIGKRPHPRGYGTYPRVIREYALERNWLTMEQAIYKMSGFPAKRFGLDRRGTLAEEHYADIVVFDPRHIRDRATFHEPRLAPEGIDDVFVNGQPVIRGGSALPGNPGRIVT